MDEIQKHNGSQSLPPIDPNGLERRVYLHFGDSGLVVVDGELTPGELRRIADLAEGKAVANG